MALLLDALSIVVAPAVGVIGVWLGAKTQGDRDERRLEREETVARENRLFEHRRVAYDDFVKQARTLYYATYNDTHDLPGHEMPPGDDTYELLIESAESVGLYAPEDTASCARDLARDIRLYGLLGVDPAKEEQAVDESFDRFRALTRRDLGVVVHRNGIQSTGQCLESGHTEETRKTLMRRFRIRGLHRASRSSLAVRAMGRGLGRCTGGDKTRGRGFHPTVPRSGTI